MAGRQAGDGKLKWWAFFRTEHEALKAAGLREQSPAFCASALGPKALPLAFDKQESRSRAKRNGRY